MKWESLQPTEGDFDYTTADEIVSFAKENNMAVRGHCLVWHNQTPDWVFLDSSNNPVTKEVLIKRMKNHIINVMTHFKNKVYCWDVVNEAIAGNNEDGVDAGEDLSQVDSWGYRNSDWYKICGEDYIIEAFRAARTADPNAKLFYKDFFDMFRRNSHSITGVTFWGIADDNTWLSEFASGRPDYPLLFDKRLEPKKAFYAITDFNR